MANYKLVNAEQLDADMKTVADKIREKSQLSDSLVWPDGFIDGVDQCSSLNFSVLGGTTQPNDPIENAIWINTDTEITSWVFSATEPETPEEGMVWITTSTASSAEFNALKKNGIQVYPMAAKQYVSGAWVTKTFLVYQDEQWKDLVLYLVNGGVVTYPISLINNGVGSAWVDSDSVLSMNASAGTNYNTAIIAYITDEKVSFDNFTKITVNATILTAASGNYNEGGVFVCITDNQSLGTSIGANAIAIAKATALGNHTLELDTSLISGEHYVQFGVWAYADKFTSCYVGAAFTDAVVS